MSADTQLLQRILCAVQGSQDAELLEACLPNGDRISGFYTFGPVDPDDPSAGVEKKAITWCAFGTLLPLAPQPTTVMPCDPTEARPLVTVWKKDAGDPGMTIREWDNVDTRILTDGEEINETYAAEILAGFQYTSTPDLTRVHASMDMNDSFNTASVVNLQVGTFFLCVEKPLAVMLDNNSTEGFARLDVSYCCSGPARTILEGWSWATTRPPSEVDGVAWLPPGIHALTLYGLDVGGSGHTVSVRTTLDNGATMIPISGARDGVTLSTTKPTEECCLGYLEANGDVTQIDGTVIPRGDYRECALPCTVPDLVDSTPPHDPQHQVEQWEVSTEEFTGTDWELDGTEGGWGTLAPAGGGQVRLWVEEEAGSTLSIYGGGLAFRPNGYISGNRSDRCAAIDWSLPDNCTLSFTLTGNYLRWSNQQRALMQIEPCPTDYELIGPNVVFDPVLGQLGPGSANTNAVTHGMRITVAGSGRFDLRVWHVFGSLGTQAIRDVEVNHYSRVCTDLVSMTTLRLDGSEVTDPATLVAECPSPAALPKPDGPCDCSSDSCCESQISELSNDTFEYVLGATSNTWHGFPDDVPKCETDLVCFRAGKVEVDQSDRFWVMVGLSGVRCAPGYFTKNNWSAYVYRPAGGTRLYVYAYENNQSRGLIGTNYPPDAEVCVRRKGAAAEILVNGESVFMFPTLHDPSKPMYASVTALRNPNLGIVDVELSTCRLPGRCDDECCDTGHCDEWPIVNYDSDLQAVNGWANQGPQSLCPITKIEVDLIDVTGRTPQMFGLDPTPSSTASYSDIDHRMYWYDNLTTGGGRIGIYDANAWQGWFEINQVSQGDTLAVCQLADGYISYQLNGVEIYRSQAPHRQPMYGDVALYGGINSTYWGGTALEQFRMCK